MGHVLLWFKEKGTEPKVRKKLLSEVKPYTKEHESQRFEKSTWKLLTNQLKGWLGEGVYYECSISVDIPVKMHTKN